MVKHPLRRIAKLRKLALLGILFITTTPIIAFITQILTFPASNIKERLDFDTTPLALTMGLVWLAIGLILIYVAYPE